MDRVKNLHVEHHERNAIGIGEAQPRLSWCMETEQPGWHQASYELEITWRDGSSESCSRTSAASSLVAWPWRSLNSRERCTVRVRVTAQSSNLASEWSDSTVVETGLLEKTDWTCSLIQPENNANVSARISHRPVVFGRRISLAGDLVAARLYITAHGIYEATINNAVVGDHVLAPGWTSYETRLLYQTFDVTTLLNVGIENQIEVTVAEGWYCGRLGFLGGKSNIYGNQISLIAILDLEYADGTTDRVGTDQSWYWKYGPITSSGLYDGEHWDASEASPSHLLKRVHCSSLNDILVTPDGPPIRRTQEIAVRKVIKSPSGKEILDMGQNMVGRLRIKVQGPVGTTIILRFAEVLEDEECCFRPLRQAKATDILELSSSEEVEWEPKFTYHGFRYVEVQGWPGAIKPEDIMGVVIHTDMKRTGSFSCSNEKLNQLHSNVVWSMRGNFVGIPTDCPQRDERLGWTGDINIFSSTANYLYDTSGLLCSWLKDLSAEQEHGIVPLTIPNVVDGLETEAHAIWGDASIMLPWSLYLLTGDIKVLQRQYPSMNQWLSAIPKKASGLWDYSSDWKLGDWLDPAAPPDDPGNSRTDPSFVSDAFLVHATTLMIAISGLVGSTSEQSTFTTAVEELRASFAAEYVTANGRLAADTQTGYTLALNFGLFDHDHQYRTAADRLEFLIRRNSLFKIATGFAGTPYIGAALTKVGLTNIFYRMLLHERCPSWLYPISMGATTMWERWDSMLPDGSINPGEMTSFNHYALGAVADWMHTVVVGLRPIEPGWQVFAVEPIPGGGLDWTEGSFLSSYGICKVRWEVRAKDKSEGKRLWTQVIVPPNTSAHIKLHGWSTAEIRGSGIHEWDTVYEPPSWPPSPWYARYVDRTEDM